MLKAKTKYAIVAMVELFGKYHHDSSVESKYTECQDTEVLSALYIATKYNIPLKFLEQILQDLKKANLIISYRGSNGGYRINSDKLNITLKDILSAISESVSVTNCNNEAICDNGKKCLSHDIFSLIENKLSVFLYNISLKEISNMYVKNENMIYADYQATTPVNAAVLDKMFRYFSHDFGNPHSNTHAFGWISKEAVELSRNQIAKVINAYTNDIIFTSGATEANNLAIIGCAKFFPNKKHIVTIKTEHKCVLNTCLSLKYYDISYAKVDQNGVVDLEDLEKLIREDTLLVTIGAVNSEIGTIQPLEKIGQICKIKDVFFHSDIAQAFGKIDIDVQKMNIHFASISSHKIYGPKGVGALYMNRTKSSNRKRAKIKPLFFGGGQEFGLRSGTVPTPLVVGFGEAAEIAMGLKDEYNAKLKKYFDYFIDKLQSNLPKIRINGSLYDRYYGNINISFRGVEGESLILALKNIAVSSGSACTSDSLETSYVLKTIGLDDYMAHSSIRFSFGHATSMSDVEIIANKVIESVNYLRNISPFWELEESGTDLNKLNWTHCH